jgi:PAS domain S-box-containing protein
MKQLVRSNRLIVTAVLLAILYWFSEAIFIDYLIFAQKGIINILFVPVRGHELLMRLEVVAVIVLFSIYVQGVVNKHQRAEEEIRHLNKDLEKRVAERTAWLEDALAERERVEEKLRTSREQLEIIMGGVADGITAQDLSGRLVYANDAAGRIFGCSSAQALLNTSMENTVDRFEITDEEGKLFAFESLIGRVAVHRGRSLEATLRLRDVATDKERWIEIEASPVFDARGGIQYEVTIFHDVTERKRAERQIAFQAQLLEQVSAAVIATDMQGMVLIWNRYAEELYGWTRQEALDRDIAELTVGPTEVEVAEEIMERLRAGKDWEGEFVVRRKDGSTFPAYVTDSLVYDARGNAVGMVGVSTDISERKQLEEALLEIREAERRRIARDLHDVVLQDLSSVLQRLQARQVESQTVCSGNELVVEIDTLRRATRGVRDSIYDLRLEGRQPFIRTIESLVELNRQLMPQCEVKLSIEESSPSELPEAVGVELLRIVQEALANARRHSGAQCVEVRLEVDHSELGVEISDNGVGFDLAALRGGLGVQGMQERAVEFGGSVEITSGATRGTLVRIRAPLPSNSPGD